MTDSHSKAERLDDLLARVRGCTLCARDLPLGPRPVVVASASARILIVGQAPGTRVHASGIPWDDPSGDRLRDWMGLDKAAFYDPRRIAIVPMGFCYPGRGRSGDLPPRRECAQTWRAPLLGHLENIELTLLVGRYAQAWHLGGRNGRTLTATVEDFERYLPATFVTPHPSPRNQYWLRQHPWFEARLLPRLRRRVAGLMADPG